MRAACAVVLAGGRSRRFGRDKTLAPFGGEPLVARVVRTLRAVGFEQVVITAKDVARHAAFGEVLEDASPAQTPLSGLVAGLRASRHELVFACAADMPFVADAPLLDALFAAAGMTPAPAIVMPRHAGALQPLAAVWRKPACLEPAEALLSMPSPPGPRVLTARLPSVLLDWPSALPFLDADTPEALRELDAHR